jgi:hypothetical protein
MQLIIIRRGVSVARGSAKCCCATGQHNQQCGNDQQTYSLQAAHAGSQHNSSQHQQCL